MPKLDDKTVSSLPELQRRELHRVRYQQDDYGVIDEVVLPNRAIEVRLDGKKLGCIMLDGKCVDFKDERLPV